MIVATRSDACPSGSSSSDGPSPAALAAIIMFSIAQPRPAKCSRSLASLIGIRRDGSERIWMTSELTPRRQGWVLCGLQASTPAATTRSTPDSAAQSRQSAYGVPNPAVNAPFDAARTPMLVPAAMAAVPAPMPIQVRTDRRLTFRAPCPSIAGLCVSSEVVVMGRSFHSWDGHRG